jgi:hypothetical protein
MHDILSSWERRALLYFLRDHEGPASMDRLAAHVVGWRRGDSTPAREDEDDVCRTRTVLLHAHVVKMEEFGVLAYDPREDTVRLNDGMTVAVDPPWQERNGEGTRESERATTVDA